MSLSNLQGHATYADKNMWLIMTDNEQVEEMHAYLRLHPDVRHKEPYDGWDRGEYFWLHEAYKTANPVLARYPVPGAGLALNLHWYQCMLNHDNQGGRYAK